MSHSESGRDPATLLIDLLAELDRLGRADDAGQEGLSKPTTDAWIEPLIEGQSALDLLGKAMRDEAAGGDDGRRGNSTD